MNTALVILAGTAGAFCTAAAIVLQMTGNSHAAIRLELEDKPKFFGDVVDVWVYVPSARTASPLKGFQRKVIDSKPFYNVGLMGRRLPQFLQSQQQELIDNGL